MLLVTSSFYNSQKETSTIPIVVVVGDPVAAGLVQNLARPERNITGIAADAGIEMQGKHFDPLRQAIPSASRVAYLSPREDWEGAWGHAANEAGRRLGVSIVGTPVENSAEEPQYRKHSRRWFSSPRTRSCIMG